MSKSQSEANLYDLYGTNLRVTYSSTGIDGKPHFLYQDQTQALSFTGDEIRTAKSEIGTLVTVSISRTVDTGFTSFTLVVPSVDLDQSRQATITTLGITTMHRAGPIASLFHGQTETSTAVSLSGVARQVAF